MYTLRLIILSSILLSLSPCIFVLHAQQIFSKRYTTHDGLIHPQITDLFKDSRGYLWIATKGGISKFNGRQFERYYFNEIGLSSAIENIFEDSHKRIWATNRQGIAIFDGCAWKTSRCPTPLRDVIRTSLFNDILFYVDQSSNIWAFSNGVFTKINWVNSTSFTLRTMFYCPLTQNFYFKMQANSDVFVLKDDTIRPYKKFAREKLSWYQSCNTYVYSECAGKNVRLYDLKGYLVQQFPARAYAHEFKIFTDKNKFTIAWNELNGIINENNLLAPLLNGKNQPEISAFWMDEQNFWIGTERGLLQVSRWPVQFFPEDIFPYPWGILEEESGRMIITDFLKGVYAIDKNDDIHNLSTIPRWYPHPVKSESGEIFLNNEHQIYNLTRNRLKGYSQMIEKQNGFSASEYLHWSTYQNKLICAQRGGFGMFDPKQSVYIPYKFENDSFKSPFVNCIAEMQDGTLCMGSTAGCVFFNPHDCNYTYFHSGSPGFPIENVNALMSINDSMLLVGAANGLWTMHIKNFRVIRVLENSIKSAANNIQVYRDSLLIVGHFQGLTFIQIKSLLTDSVYFRSLNLYNGFPGQIPRQNASCIDSKGRFWFSAFDRLCRMDLNELHIPFFIPKIQWTRINGNAIPYTNINELKTTGDDVRLEFEWIDAPQFENPEFRYRVVGKTDWSEKTNQTIVSLPELSSGKYKIELQSHWDQNGNSIPISSNINIHVSQPIWQEPYFNTILFMVAAILVAGFFILSFYIRYQRYHLKNLELQSKYHQARMLTAQLNPHFTSNFLNTIIKSIKFNHPEEAEDKVQQASIFLRKFLGSLRSKEKNGLISLQDELDIIRIYLEMENVLHSGALNFKIEMEEHFDPYEWLVPPMILQPFVENAIVWGIDSKVPNSGNIHVEVQELAEQIQICIEDDGVGIRNSQELNGHLKRSPEESGAQIVRERIELLKSLGIYLQYTVNSNDSGTRVCITYPKIKA